MSHRGSFTNVKDRWYPEVKHFCPDIPIMLVGTKSDIRCESESNGEALDLVDEDEAKKVAYDIGAVEYLECSGLTRQGLKTVFDNALTIGLDLKPKKKVIAKKSSKCSIL